MNATNQVLRDIKPPVEIPSGLAWLAWLLVGLFLLSLVFALWRWWQRRRQTVPAPVIIPPHVKARERLNHALAFLHQPREFAILVSDAIRWYLEERFNFRAPERTTEEFLHDLQGTQLLSEPQKESLAAFLQSCDLLKFARYEPAEPELRALHEAALRLVDETEPTTVPEGSARPETQAPPAA